MFPNGVQELGGEFFSGFNSASAAAFYAVHAFVGCAEDGVDGAAVAGVGGYAGAGADGQL